MATLWHRCPGVVTDKKSDGFGRTMEGGCWVSIGLVDVKMEKGGRLFCPHCGDDAVRVAGKQAEEIPSNGTPALKAYVSRINAEDLDNADVRKFDFSCCYNAECSSLYLNGEARGSDAVLRTDKGQRPCHSGTQFVMYRDPSAADTWDFSDGNDEPRIDEKGRSWRKCIFCGSLLRVPHSRESKQSAARDIETHPGSDDGQRWHWTGPAATFRICREAEYLALTRKKLEPAGAR